MMKRVAVIGAGAGGLCALRHLAAKPNLYQPVAFEQTASVGGTWVYTERVGLDENGLAVHSSMYSNLKTNLPKEVMMFPDFPFPVHGRSFIGHQEVKQYLEDYAEHFKLNKYIKFNTCVERLHPVTDGGRVRWDMSVRKIPQTEAPAEEHSFDAVIVCNGHYVIPLCPDLPGLSTFKGRIVHSHVYRHPEDFSGLRVVCLGAGSSGQDIALDLARHAKQVILSHRKGPLQSELPANVRQAPGINEVLENSVVLANGEEVELDVLLLCTGYRYTFPFLTEDCRIDIDNERVVPLYKHIINAHHPTLSFIGICKVIIPFPQFECQVRFVLSALEGTMNLPSAQGMLEDIKSDYEERLSCGMPHRYAHHMADRQWAYNDLLADLGGFKRLPHFFSSLAERIHHFRATQLQTYKMLNYEIIDSETFKEIPSSNIPCKTTDG